MRRLLIIDGHAIAHRAYHSIPKLSQNGQPVNALYGFYSMLLSAIHTLKPKYVLVCLDSPGPNFRNQEFLGYRAKRKPADPDLVSQLPLLRSTLEATGIPVFSMGGYEADDLIATVAKKALKKFFVGPKGKKKLVTKVTIITGDKDLMQLVDNKIELFVPIRGLSETKLYSVDEVKEKLGVLPTQVVDLKALMGDMSDNYPGVAGIGPKAAIELLTQYDNLDEIYRHLDDVKPSVKIKLETDKDNAYLSQKLATLVDDIPLQFALGSAKWSQGLKNGLAKIFKDYNFRSLLDRLNKNFIFDGKKDQDPLQTSLF